MTDDDATREILRGLEITVTRLQAEVSGLRDDVQALVDMRDWVIRIILGAVLVALLAIVIKGAP